jgi:hypothetical protein
MTTSATLARNEGAVSNHRARLQTSRTTEQQKQLKEAVERVYERYGSDLSAFFQDVKKEIQIKRGA